MLAKDLAFAASSLFAFVFISKYNKNVLNTIEEVYRMRSAKDAENFPYGMSTLCYFEVDNVGNVLQVPHKNKSNRQNVLEAYNRAVDKTTTLYAVWPGNWRSDLFIIDDLSAFAKEFDLI